MGIITEDRKIYSPVFIITGSSALIRDYDLYRSLVKKHEIMQEDIIDNEGALDEIRNLAGVSQTGVYNEHQIEYRLEDSLCSMIRESDVSNREELRKIVGLSMDSSITASFLKELIDGSSVTLLELPVTREELFRSFRGLKMSGTIAFALVEALSCGEGLSDDMRDELWMDFAPDWLTSYCEKISYLPGNYELEQQMEIMMTIAWFRRREKVVYNAG